MRRSGLGYVPATGVLPAAATANVAGKVTLRIGLEPGEAARTLEPQAPGRPDRDAHRFTRPGQSVTVTTVRMPAS